MCYRELPTVVLLTKGFTMQPLDKYSKYIYLNIEPHLRIFINLKQETYYIIIIIKAIFSNIHCFSEHSFLIKCRAEQYVDKSLNPEFNFGNSEHVYFIII